MKHVKLGNNVYASFYSSWNPLYRNQVKRLAKLSAETVHILSPFLTLPDDQRIVIRCLDYGYGEFRFVGQTIHMEHRRETDFLFIETLCHELVHAEQYYTRRMEFLMTDDHVNIRFNGVMHQIDGGDMSEEWRPWETEAYSRQRNLAEYTMERLERIGYSVSW